MYESYTVCMLSFFSSIAFYFQFTNAYNVIAMKNGINNKQVNSRFFLLLLYGICKWDLHKMCDNMARTA